MKQLLFYIFGIVLCLQISCKKDNSKLYDESKVSSENYINPRFTKERGIKDKNGVVYFVEKDLQTLTAYEKNKTKWKTNIINVCGKPYMGEPKISSIELRDSSLWIVFGKHSFASVKTKDGKTTFEGQD
jgi:hypothetical protein